MAYTYKYPRPSVTADCIVITREAEPKVLLIQRGDEPFKGGWAFPGGFMNMDETDFEYRMFIRLEHTPRLTVTQGGELSLLLTSL